MCGVFFLHSPTGDLDPTVRVLKHRGPDGEGTFNCPFSKVRVDFFRLAIREIVDGVQPLVTKDFVSSINGELYNQEFIEERIKSLNPHTQIPKGDMNVLAQYLFLTEGKGISEALGMFAGFVWFRERNQVLYFRDRIGEKPLFFLKDKEIFAISSECRFDELLNSSEFRPTLARGNLILGFFDSKESDLIQMCKPGYYYWYDLKSSQITPTKYWQWPNFESGTSKVSDQKRFQFSLLEAIDSQLISDVPISIFFSSGVDSALLAGIIRKEFGIKIPTVTLGFTNDAWDESKRASRLAKDIDVPNEVFKVGIDLLVETIPKVVQCMDLPILDSGCISLFALSRIASEHYKVAITGDGGDEISQGYSLFDWIRVLELINFTKKFGIGMCGILSTLKPSREGSYNSIQMKLERAASTIHFSKNEIPIIALSPLAGTSLIRSANFSKLNDLDFGNLDSYYKNFILPLVYLRKSDMMSMAHGLELRSPYLDKRVVETSSAVRFRGPNKRKKLLLELAKDYLPDYMQRNRKHGFSAPISSILKYLPEPNWREELLKDFGGAISQVWRKAPLNQNCAIAAWSLYVVNEFVSSGRIEYQASSNNLP